MTFHHGNRAGYPLRGLHAKLLIWDALGPMPISAHLLVMPMRNEIRPNKAELEFSNLAYNRFYDIFDEMMDDSFWRKKKAYRFSRLTIAFAVYAELLNYEPIGWVIEHLKKNRPPSHGIGNRERAFPVCQKHSDAFSNLVDERPPPRHRSCFLETAARLRRPETQVKWPAGHFTNNTTRNLGP